MPEVNLSGIKKFLQLFPVITFSLLSCKHNTKQQAPLTLDKIKPPKVILAGKPIVVNMDTCYPAFVVNIQKKDSQLYKFRTAIGPRELMITPPKTNLADFFVTMECYNSDRGLAMDAVISSYQDRTGNLWFGTLGGGVTKFDGHTSVTFTTNEGLGNNNVANITGDEEGNIWFSLNGGGIAKYDGRFITGFTKANGLLSNEVHSMVIRKKNDFLLGTREGLSFFDGRTFSNFKSPDSMAGKDIITCVQDNKGETWLGTNQSGVSSFNGSVFSHYDTRHGLVNNRVMSSYKDQKGRLWFGTDGGASMFDGKAFTNFPHVGGSGKHTIHSIGEDRLGNIWFGSFGAGITRYDGHDFFTITTKQGLSNNVVQCFTKDHSGNLWIGTEGGGANCYNDGAFISFTTAQGLPDNVVRNVIEDRMGNYWIGTNSGGVCRYDGKTFTIFNRSQGLWQNRVNRVFEDKAGNLWFCTNAGVSKYDGKKITTLNTTHGLIYNAVRSIIEDRNGNLWFGTEMGLSKYDGKSFYNFTNAQGLPGKNVRDILEDEAGNLWLGSIGDGLSRYDGESFLRLDTAQGLSNIHIANLTKDSRGNIWACTEGGGVSILRKKIIDKLKNVNEIKPGDKLFENFTIEEGLSDNVVYDAVEDKQGNMIIGTNMGITVIKDGLDPEKPISKDKIEYFNWKNGYLVKDVNTQAMYVDSKGFIWIGTGEKLIRFDYSAIYKNPDPPTVKIQGIKVNNENICWYDLISGEPSKKSDLSGYLSKDKLLSSLKIEETFLYGKPLNTEQRESMQGKYAAIEFDSISPFYPLPINLKLPYEHNNISFGFAAIEPARSYLVRYQYMLEGYDKDWMPVTEKPTAIFGNIDEGNYTFKLKAMSPDGVWSKPILYSFKILPPWYRTWWAYAAYITTIISILYGLYIGRIKNLENKQALQLQTVITTQEEERKRISRDLHDDVGTKLSALKLFLSSLKRSTQQKNYEEMDQLVHNSEQLINETIKDVRSMLLNLSPGILEEFGFINAIAVLINKINQSNTIHFQLSVFGITGKLKSEYELALYRITQELINNVIKHSDAKNVTVQVGCRDEKIIIMIEDDGRGFDQESHQEGYGLRNLEARTKLLNGNMKIDSQIGKGTSISIEVPYKINS